jgi:tetratricopeptide (TPR) repeat protein
LDTWADHRNNQVARNEPGWKRLLDVAQAADSNPWRNQVRQALRQGDRAALNQLAASANVRDLPLESLSLLIYRGRLDDAVRKTLLREAQHEHPDDFWINFQLGWDDYSSEKNLNECIRFFTASVTARPGNAPARYFLADALRQAGRLEECLAEYRKAAELAGNDSRMLNNIAWVLATCPEAKLRDPGQAVQLARKAVELEPLDGGAWNTLGVALYRAENMQEAITALRKAEELESGKYFAWNAFFLSMVRWKVGEKQQARKEYEQAVQWMDKTHPNDKDLRRFRAEAEELLGIGHR